MRESARMQAVQSPIIPVVAEWIRSCPGTISLGQGVVSYGPPPSALARIAEFLKDPENNKYKPVVGLPALLDAIQQKLASENRIGVTSSNAIVVTAGGNMAFMNALLAIADPGDEVIIQTPYYFNHEMAIAMASCRPVLVETDEQFQLRPDAIAAAITPKTRAVVTISPNNPTGAVYAESALREVNRICGERGIYHIHDEAYENFLYDGAKHYSPASADGSEGHTISLFSLSKAYGFASWRIGYMVFPRALLEAVRKIQDTIVICAPVISQFAAIGALETGAAYCAEKLNAIKQVRTIVSEKLREISDICEVPRANGAFYFLLRLRPAGAGLDPLKTTERLIREHGVAVIPGNAFGIREGCYLRVAYGALQRETAAEGIGRLVRGLKALAH